MEFRQQVPVPSVITDLGQLFGTEEIVYCCPKHPQQVALSTTRMVVDDQATLLYRFDCGCQCHVALEEVNDAPR